MNGIMALRRGGPPGSGSGAHKDYKGSYKTGSKSKSKSKSNNNKGNKESRQKTANELDQMILSGDNKRGGKDFLSGKISAAERRQQLLELAQRGRRKGIPFKLDTEEFTRNKAGKSNADPTGKLREGMTSPEYAKFMGELHGANPTAMQKAFPWSSGKALGNIAKLALPAPIKFGLGALKKFGQLAPIKDLRKMGRNVRDFAGQFVPEDLRVMGRDFKNLGLNALRTAGQLGPVKDLTNMFGLGGLDSKLVDIAGGGDNNQFKEIINQNKFRNNLAQGDPLGLNKKFPASNDPIMNMGLPNLYGDDSFHRDANGNLIDPARNALAAHRDASLSGYYPNKVMASASSPYETGAPNPYENFTTLDDKIDYLTKRQGVDVSNMSPSTINSAYQKAQSVDNRREAFNREERDPGIINLASPESINLSRDPDEIFEDVSETEYVDPNEVIKQGNNYVYDDYRINEELSNQGVDPNSFPEKGVSAPIGTYTDGTPMYAEDQTDIFNVGSFPKLDIFGNEVGGPRHHLLNQINKWGNAPSASEKEAFDILNSLGQADGGYMSSFPNQNLNTESLSASDNIDDRIMKNLQFEKMAPGMMGYHSGGKVMSTFEKLKAIADNNYG